jgi:hypothetical protein
MNLPPSATSPFCEATLPPNGVIQIEWHELSRAAVDAHFQLLHDLFSNSDTTLRFLHYSTKGAMPPINYMLAKTKTLLNQHRGRTANNHTAVLYQDNVIIVLFDSLLQTLIPQRQGKLRFFKFTESAAAQAWLLSLP